MQALSSELKTTAPTYCSRLPVICHLLHTLHIGGAEVLAARLARQLRTEGRFVFVCLDEAGPMGPELRSEGFTVEVVGRRGGVDGRCAWQLANLLRQHQVDLVHAHQYTPFFYALFARLAFRRPAVLFTEHGRHFPDYPRPKRIIANRLLLERRDRVVGVGYAVRQALIANECIPPSRVRVIFNGIDANGFADGGQNREATRLALGIKPDEFAILLVARLDYLKDHATALRAFRRVKEKQPNAKLILVGDGPEREALQRQAEHEGLGSQVLFLGLRRDVAQLLHASDLFLLTSISEGIPLTVIEAMAAGKPVVATKVGGLPEVVADGKTALLAPPGDDAGLAHQVLRLIHDSALRQNMGQLGIERARAAFSESHMHSRYLALYREMLHG